MKIYKVIVATREEWLKENGELTSLYFTNKGLANEQLSNAEMNGLEGFIHELTIVNTIIDYKYVK